MLSPATERNLCLLSRGNLALLLLYFLFLLLLGGARRMAHNILLPDCDINHYILTPVCVVTSLTAIVLLGIILRNWSGFASVRNRRVAFGCTMVVLLHFLLQAACIGFAFW